MKRALAGGLLLAVGLAAGACSLGDGSGEVISKDLNAPDCWEGGYDLKPDFFAAVPDRNSLVIRIQRGSDFEGVSDGIIILVDDVQDVRKNHLGQPIPVTLPEGVAPPGIPEGTLCGESCSHTGVHLTFYLLHSCFNINTVLYGISGTITFTQLFSNDPNESDAAEKLIQGELDLMVGDPQQIVTSGPDKGTIPDQSQITGRFRFYFQRGQPAQPFP